MRRYVKRYIGPCEETLLAAQRGEIAGEMCSQGCAPESTVQCKFGAVAHTPESIKLARGGFVLT